MFNVQGYCWTHGFKVGNKHSSKTCNRRYEGHKEEATFEDNMGGSQLNKNWHVSGNDP